METVSSVSPVKNSSSFSRMLQASSDFLLSQEKRADEQGNFTFPQLTPSCILQETLHSLDSKVPLIPGLNEVLMLCTTKIGTKRFQTPDDAEFDLRTPQSPGLEYNNLHDPHLKKYFQKPYVRDSLTKQGLITKDGFVKCSTREFNEYRQWIRRLKLNKMDAEAKEIQELERQERQLEDDEPDVPRRQPSEHALEILEANKQKRFIAKKNYLQRKRKEKEQRKRLMKHLEQEFKTKAELREDQQHVKKMKCKNRETEEELRRLEHKKNEDIQKAARIQALAEKDEQYKKRQKEIKDYRKMDRKNKERKAIEKWKRRQTYCFRMMEEKKVQIEKEMQERRESMLRRNDAFNRERQKREEQHEKSMQLRRELANDHLQKANKFIEKAEKKKEAEIKRWREKNLVRMSPKLHPQRPDAIETSKSKKSRGKGKKGSMWKIDNCLTASDYTDKSPGRSTNSTAANKRPSDMFDNAAILKDNSDDLRHHSHDNGMAEKQGCEDDSVVEKDNCQVTDHSSESVDISATERVASQVQDGKEAALSASLSDDTLSEVIAISWQIAEETVLRAASKVGIDRERARRAIGRNREETGLRERTDSSGHCWLPSKHSLYESNITTVDSFYETRLDSTSSSVPSIDNGKLSASHSLGEVNSSMIFSTANKLIKGIIGEALSRLALDDEEYSIFCAEIKKQNKSMESCFDAKSSDLCNENSSYETSKADGSSLIGSNVGTCKSSEEIPLESLSQMLEVPVTMFSETMISEEAKRLAEEALRQALVTLGSSESIADHMTSDSTLDVQSSLKEATCPEAGPSFQANEYSASDSGPKRRSSSEKGLDFSGQTLGGPKGGGSSGSDLSIKAKKIAFKAIENALVSIEVSDVEGPSANHEKPPDFNAKDGKLRSRAKSVVKDVVVGAAGKSGCRSEEIVKLEEYFGGSDSRQSERTSKAKVHFESSIEAAVVRTPSNNVSLLASRLPTPHASTANLLERTGDHEVETSTQIEQNDSKDAENYNKEIEKTSELNANETCKVEDVPEISPSFASEESVEKIMAMSKAGRRPTPFFSCSDKKRLFDQVNGGRKSLKMESFGEVGSELMASQPKFSNMLLINSNEAFLDSGVKGSAPELGRRRSVGSHNVRKTFSSIIPSECPERPFSIRGLEGQKECENNFISNNKNEASGSDVAEKKDAGNCADTVNDGDIHSNPRVNLKVSLHSRKSLGVFSSKREDQNLSSESGLAIRSSSNGLSRSGSLNANETSSVKAIKKGSSSSMKGDKQPSSSRLDGGQRGSFLFNDKRGSRLSCATGSSKGIMKQRLSDQLVNGKKTSDFGAAKSDNSVGSSSSHFLPHVRASRSRMTCKIDPSVYSCATDEIESKGSMDSQDMLGLTDDQETEQVVQIVQPESDAMDQGLQERFLSSENIEKVTEKLNELASSYHVESERPVETNDLREAEDGSWKEDDKIVTGSVTGFKYSDYVEIAVRKDESERSDQVNTHAEIGLAQSNIDRVSSSNIANNRCEASDEESVEAEAGKPVPGSDGLKEQSNDNPKEDDIVKCNSMLTEEMPDELLHDFVVIEESEVAKIMHVKSGRLDHGDGSGSKNDAKEKRMSFSANERFDTGAIEQSSLVSQKSNCRERSVPNEHCQNDREALKGQESSRSENTRTTKTTLGESCSLELSSLKRRSNSKMVSKSETGRRGSFNKLSRTVSKASWLNFDRRSSEKSRASIVEPKFGFPKEADDRKVENSRRMSGNSVVLEPGNEINVAREDEESRATVDENDLKEVLSVN